MEAYDIVDRIERIAREIDHMEYGEMVYVREYDTICLEIEFYERGIKRLIEENGFSLDTFESSGQKLVYCEFTR